MNDLPFGKHENGGERVRGPHFAPVAKLVDALTKLMSEGNRPFVQVRILPGAF